uniref:Uncharacterized protein n=1 Tax=Strombidium inclinatum TaxID=197538 RepID=A0A7S3MT98_9SPIT|mmetsp:Transcript_13221/g.20629  ORF Transcript_13221/g.20629 Transcript_13221/m.20629 type:complete len:122 (+) Transcript_13221:575-940(+)
MGRSWEDLEAQRDMAFKIVYFFITFAIVTFGLLYVYFRINKDELERERENKATRMPMAHDENFFDFLAGQMEMDPQSSLAGLDDSEHTFKASSRQVRKEAPTAKYTHRENTGFGNDAFLED